MEGCVKSRQELSHPQCLHHIARRCAASARTLTGNRRRPHPPRSCPPALRRCRCRKCLRFTITLDAFMRGFKDTLAFSMKQGPFNRLSHLPNAFLFTQVLNDRMSPSPTCPWAENVPFARSFWSHLTLRQCGYADADRQRPLSGRARSVAMDAMSRPVARVPRGPPRRDAFGDWRRLAEVWVHSGCPPDHV